MAHMIIFSVKRNMYSLPTVLLALRYLKMLAANEPWRSSLDAELRDCQKPTTVVGEAAMLTMYIHEQRT